MRKIRFVWSTGPAGPAVALALAVLLLLAGCDGVFARKPQPQQPPPQPVKFIASYDDTIGAYCDLPVDQYTLVRGYGLVLLRRPTGSRECPPGIRKFIVDQLSQMRVGETSSLMPGVTIDGMIDSMNTAVVEVRGLLPAAGLRGEAFDILVTALPGTQTTSLEGGVLIRTELSLWRRSRTGGLIHGKPLALASGSVFINPFAELSSNPAGGEPVGTPADPRRGWVLGGALALKDQDISLSFNEPNYRLANLAMEQLNTLFPSDYLHGVAHAVGPSLIELKVPREYRTQVNYWLALVQQVYLRREPGFLEQRLVQLLNELGGQEVAEATRMRIALTMISIGKSVLPQLQPQYASESESVSFYAAYAGLRLGDSLALQVMQRIAHKKGAAYQLLAIRALGQPHRFVNIGDTLAPLLSEENPEIRIAAYESMAALGSAYVTRENVGLDNIGFQFDIVRCGGPFLIYVTRTRSPRIVIFGGDKLKLNTPCFLHSPRTGLTIQADADARQATLIRIDPRTGQLMIGGWDVGIEHVSTTRPDGSIDKQPRQVYIPRTDIKCDLMLADLIRTLGRPASRDGDHNLLGLDLNYSQTVHVLYKLSQQGSIPCKVYLQPIAGPNLDLAGDTELPDTGDVAQDDSIEPTGRDRRRPTSQPEPAGNTVKGMQIEAPEGGAPKIGG